MLCLLCVFVMLKWWFSALNLKCIAVCVWTSLKHRLFQACGEACCCFSLVSGSFIANETINNLAKFKIVLSFTHGISRTLCGLCALRPLKGLMSGISALPRKWLKLSCARVCATSPGELIILDMCLNKLCKRRVFGSSDSFLIHGMINWLFDPQRIDSLPF